MTNDSPQAKSGPLPVFINKVLLDTASFFHSHIAYGCLGTATAELNTSGRDCMAYTP